MIDKSNKIDKSISSPLKVFLMGGTKDSIDIIKFLKEEYDSTYILTTTTTEYGANLAKAAGSDDVISKPLSKKEIVNILSDVDFSVENIGENKNKNITKDISKNNTSINNKSKYNTSKNNKSKNNKSKNNKSKNNTSKFDIFIDATHPYAANATTTAIESAKEVNIPYIRFERPCINLNIYEDKSKLHIVDSFKEAGELIAKDFKGKNVLHLAGVNTIVDILKSNQVDKENFFARVLPVKSSIEKCNALGIKGEHIIAMQGVFSKDFNKQLMEELDTEVIITKESGSTGGVPSKIAAANELGIAIILINRPKIANLKEDNIVHDFFELKEKLNFF